MDINLAIGMPALFPYVHLNFWKSFHQLEKPINHFLIISTGSITSVARNRIVEQARARKCTHIMFLDQDMTFPKDTITKMINANKDIVCGLYFQRDYPHLPTGMISINEKEYSRITKKQIESNQLIEVDAAGTGCMLIKEEVFEAMGYPWFDYSVYKGYTWYTEDVMFSRKAKKLGYKIWYDTSIKCGHIIDYELTEKDWKLEAT